MPELIVFSPLAVQLILQVACGVLLLRTSLAGRPWLLSFIGANLFLLMFGFLLPFVWQAGFIERETMNNLMDQYVPVASIAASVLLIRFAVVLRAHCHETDAAGMEAEARPETSTWQSSLPPGWLMILTSAASVACLIHNINGSFMRSIVAGFAPPSQTGAGFAAEFAAQLEFSANVANAVGGLYIVTVLLWVMCAGFVAFAISKRRVSREGRAL